MMVTEKAGYLELCALLLVTGSIMVGNAEAQNCTPGVPCDQTTVAGTQKTASVALPGGIYGAAPQRSPAQTDKRPVAGAVQQKQPPPPTLPRPPAPTLVNPAQDAKPQKKTTGDGGSDRHVLMPEEAKKEQEIQIDIPAGGMSTVVPEVATQVPLSSSDINRVVCSAGDIKDVVYSKEKSVTVKMAGKNAFIKFHVVKKDEKDVYATIPTELFFICGENTFNIIGVPKRIPSQTIGLSSGKQETIKKNGALFGELPYERRVISLIKKVYMDDISESLNVVTVSKPVAVFKQVELVLKRIVTVEGEGLRVKEYTANLRPEHDTIMLKEKEFLRGEITSKPLAISVDITNLKKGETARILIVEQGEGM